MACVPVDLKSNAIKALPELLASLDITGCVVTTDALGRQRAVAAQMVAQSGEYVLRIASIAPPRIASIAPPRIASIAPPRIASIAPPRIASIAPPRIASMAMRFDRATAHRFDRATAHRFEDVPHQPHTETTVAQGRVETRRAAQINLSDLQGRWDDMRDKGSGLSSLLRVESVRQVGATQETRSFLSSLCGEVTRAALG